jgi:hypothetical protein
VHANVFGGVYWVIGKVIQESMQMYLVECIGKVIQESMQMYLVECIEKVI